MKYRKLHINGKIWTYFIGKRYIEIKSPCKERTLVLIADIYMDDEETAKKRAKHNWEWRRYSWDYPNIMPSDVDLDGALIATSGITPSKVKEYIFCKMLNGTNQSN